jgi:hypothetical protein
MPLLMIRCAVRRGLRLARTAIPEHETAAAAGMLHRALAGISSDDGYMPTIYLYNMLKNLSNVNIVTALTSEEWCCLRKCRRNSALFLSTESFLLFFNSLSVIIGPGNIGAAKL